MNDDVIKFSIFFFTVILHKVLHRALLKITLQNAMIYHGFQIYYKYPLPAFYPTIVVLPSYTYRLAFWNFL